MNVLNLFKKKPLLDEETALWQLETLGWIIENFDGVEQLRETPNVVPTDVFFPPKKDFGRAKAERMFDRVKELAGLENWPCKLEAIDSRAPFEVGTGLGQVFETSAALGTFSVEGDQKPAVDVIIRYDAGLVDEPVALVATFAHELAHYLMATAQTWGPGGIELHEHATDALAVHMGFGVFLANSAFEAEAHSDALSMGHNYQKQGYLSESELAYALALFLKITANNVDEALSHLKPRLQKNLKHALADLENIADVENAAIAAWHVYKETDGNEPL